VKNHFHSTVINLKRRRVPFGIDDDFRLAVVWTIRLRAWEIVDLTCGASPGDPKMIRFFLGADLMRHRHTQQRPTGQESKTRRRKRTATKFVFSFKCSFAYR
jgi:hypothetical protein